MSAATTKDKLDTIIVWLDEWQEDLIRLRKIREAERVREAAAMLGGLRIDMWGNGR